MNWARNAHPTVTRIHSQRHGYTLEAFKRFWNPKIWLGSERSGLQSAAASNNLRVCKLSLELSAIPIYFFLFLFLLLLSRVLSGVAGSLAMAPRFHHDEKPVETKPQNQRTCRDPIATNSTRDSPELMSQTEHSKLCAQTRFADKNQFQLHSVTSRACNDLASKSRIVDA